jgi:tetratricopeptide (TPR) repeat protein
MSKTIKRFLTTGLAAGFLAGCATSVFAATAEIEILQTTRVLATEAAEAGNCDETLRLLIPFAEIVREAQDVHSGRLLGWCLGATGEPQRAVDWREQVSRWTGADSDREALAAALAEVGQQDAALIIARDLMDRNPDAARLVHDILLSKAAAAMNAGKCEETLDLIGEASAISAPTRDDRQLRAWALYDCGRYAEAGDAFEILYVELLEDNAAQGLVLNDYQARRLDRTEVVANTHGGPLVERLPKERLPRSKDGRVEYADVFLTSDGRISGYHRREWSGLPGIGRSNRRGEGPSELDAWRLPALEVEYQHDPTPLK